MKRTLLLIALALPAGRGNAQPQAAPPVVRAKVSVVGTFRDTTLGATLMPEEASLSPNGKLIAYSSSNDLRIWNIATRTSHVLVASYVESAVWSPAGDQIAFDRPDDMGSKEFVGAINVDPVTGKATGAARRVSISPTTGNAPTFSPDGKLIAFPREDAGGGKSSVVVVPAGGGTERVLASGIAVRRLRWTPDGSAIYYVVYADSARTNRPLYRVSLSGGAPQLVHDLSADFQPQGVTGDGRAIVLHQPRAVDENTTLLADFSGKPLVKLSLPIDVGVTDWSGGYLVLGVRAKYPRGLRIVSLADGKTRDLVDTTAEVGVPTWFPDGRRIAVIARVDGKPFLLTMNADGSSRNTLPLSAWPQFTDLLTGRNNAELRISPDGRYAAFIGDARRSLELLDMKSGKQRTLAPARVGISSLVWRRDSKSVRYIRNESNPITADSRTAREVSLTGVDRLLRALPASLGQAMIFADEENAEAFGGSTFSLVPLDGGPVRVILRKPTQGGSAFSPDGRLVALLLGKILSGDATQKITLVSLADSTERTIDLPFINVGGMQFHPDSRHVFIAGRDQPGGPLTLYSVPLDGTVPRAVTRMSAIEGRSVGMGNNSYGSARQLSPDGKSLVFTVSGTPSATFIALDVSEASRFVQGGRKP